MADGGRLAQACSTRNVEELCQKHHEVMLDPGDLCKKNIRLHTRATAELVRHKAGGDQRMLGRGLAHLFSSSTRFSPVDQSQAMLTVQVRPSSIVDYSRRAQSAPLTPGGPATLVCEGMQFCRHGTRVFPR